MDFESLMTLRDGQKDSNDLEEQRSRPQDKDFTESKVTQSLLCVLEGSLSLLGQGAQKLRRTPLSRSRGFVGLGQTPCIKSNK